VPERLPTLHEAMAAVLAEKGDGIDRSELATEIARRDLWVRPSDGAPPGEDQVGLRARKYPELFEVAEGGGIRLRSAGVKPPNPTPGDRGARSPRSPRESDDAVWALTENDVVEACRDLLASVDYTIVSTATTSQGCHELEESHAPLRQALHFRTSPAPRLKGVLHGSCLTPRPAEFGGALGNGLS
jgi:hypothetical protein